MVTWIHSPCTPLSHPSMLFAASCPGVAEHGPNLPTQQCNNPLKPPTDHAIGRILPIPQGMGVNRKDTFTVPPPTGTTSSGQGFQHSLSNSQRRKRKRASFGLFCNQFICGAGLTSQPNRHATLLSTILDTIASVRVKIRHLWADALDPVASLKGACSKAFWAGTGPSKGTISLTSGQEITSILPFSTEANSTTLKGC